MGEESMIGGNGSGAGDGDSDPLLGEEDASGYRRPLPGFSTNAPALSAKDRPRRKAFGIRLR